MGVNVTISIVEPWVVKNRPPIVYEEIYIVTTLAIKLNSLNNIYSIWYFNSYLRVTYVVRSWLVVWDHRHSPPQRYDFKQVGDHQLVCRLAADQLHKLAPDERKSHLIMPGL